MDYEIKWTLTHSETVEAPDMESAAEIGQVALRDYIRHELQTEKAQSVVYEFECESIEEVKE